MADLQEGMSCTVEVQVTPEMTAAAYGNPGILVLGSPKLLALFEEAAIRAIAPGLGEGEASVGTRFEFVHAAPTPVGMRIRARATLARLDGRRAVFRLEAWDDVDKVAEGEHERAVIDLARFRDRAEKKRRD
jgi:predicted thioesterase